MAAALASLSTWLAWPGMGLELGLLGLAFYRGLHRRLPVFTTYISLVVAKDVLGWWVVSGAGLDSPAYYYSYWLSQAILVTVRGCVVVELFHKVLQPYRGVWSLARLALSLTATVLVVYALFKSAASTPDFTRIILMADRSLEFAVVGTLLTLLIICRYYGVILDRPEAAVALGLALYSSFSIINNSVLSEFFSSYLQAWTIIRPVSYDAAVLIWIWPLLRPLPALAARPAIAAAGVYQELVPEFSGRMRELNDRLLDILQR